MLPTCLVKIYDRIPPLSTTFPRISCFSLNDSCEEAAKSTVNCRPWNISDICNVPMAWTKFLHNYSKMSHFHFAECCSFTPWKNPVRRSIPAMTWELQLKFTEIEMNSTVVSAAGLFIFHPIYIWNLQFILSWLNFVMLTFYRTHSSCFQTLAWPEGSWRDLRVKRAVTK